MSHVLSTRTLSLPKPERLSATVLQTLVAQALAPHERAIRIAIVAVAEELLWVEVGLKSDGGV